MTANDLMESMRKAEWHGNATDNPEGSRYVHISETLMENIIIQLKRLETENSALKSMR